MKTSFDLVSEFVSIIVTILFLLQILRWTTSVDSDPSFATFLSEEGLKGVIEWVWYGSRGDQMNRKQTGKYYVATEEDLADYFETLARHTKEDSEFRGLMGYVNLVRSRINTRSLVKRKARRVIKR